MPTDLPPKRNPDHPLMYLVLGLVALAAIGLAMILLWRAS
jgi:hypothetical protein